VSARCIDCHFCTPLALLARDYNSPMVSSRICCHCCITVRSCCSCVFSVNACVRVASPVTLHATYAACMRLWAPPMLLLPSLSNCICHRCISVRSCCSCCACVFWPIQSHPLHSHSITHSHARTLTHNRIMVTLCSYRRLFRVARRVLNKWRSDKPSLFVWSVESVVSAEWCVPACLRTRRIASLSCLNVPHCGQGRSWESIFHSVDIISSAWLVDRRVAKWGASTTPLAAADSFPRITLSLQCVSLRTHRYTHATTR
jgi:hypothetical protein